MSSDILQYFRVKYPDLDTYPYVECALCCDYVTPLEHEREITGILDDLKSHWVLYHKGES